MRQAKFSRKKVYVGSWFCRLIVQDWVNPMNLTSGDLVMLAGSGSGLLSKKQGMQASPLSVCMASYKSTRM